MFIIVISTIALIVFLFSVDQSWSNVISSQRNDLVFENRNQSYGAYALRHEYLRNMIYALLLSVGLIGGGLFAVGVLRSDSTPNKLPIPKDFNIPVIANTIDFNREKYVEPFKQKPTKPAASISNGEIEVVDTETKAMVSANKRNDMQQGAGGDGDPILQAPVGGGSGDGTGQTAMVVAPIEEARRFVRNKPLFPGGDKALMQYMTPKVKYNDKEIDRKVEGTIYISFVVKVDGTIGEITIERGILNGERLANQAMEAIRNMPRWTPGNDGMEPLPVIVTMPLKLEVRN